jgi:hypothetical protein
VFVSGRRSRWEVPFDDVYVIFVCLPYKSLILAVVSPTGFRNLSILGTPARAILASQNFGTFVRECLSWDFEVFIKLAREYAFQGTDRKTVCTINAEVYFYFLLFDNGPFNLYRFVTDCLSSRETPGCSANGISSPISSHLQHHLRPPNCSQHLQDYRTLS